MAQGTWRSGALHVWGWNGVDTASMAWFYSGFRTRAADGTIVGWHDSPISYGELGRLSVGLEHHRDLTAASARLDPFGAAVWLSELPDDAYVSPSIRWFARLAELARHTVSTGCVAPAIVEEGPFTVARWNAVRSAAVDRALDELAAAMPPICAAGSGHDPARMYEVMVDGIARSALATAGWKADLGRGRKPAVQAIRATFGALVGPDHVVRSGSDEFEQAVGSLREDLDRHRRRLAGEPVVVPRVRLLIDDDPGAPWEVRLELVDDADSTRWCTAEDVWTHSPIAVELAGSDDHVDRLAAAITDALDKMAPVVPGMADLALEHEPTGFEISIARLDEIGDAVLDFDLAEDFLAIAPVELARLGVELIGPERLVGRAPRLSGVATPTPGDDRQSSFGRDALVEWDLVVDDRPISDAELARAAAAGATLLHTGERWVRIDPDELRRKRARLDELRTTSASVSALELLQLANDDGDADTPMVRPAGEMVGTDLGGDSTTAADWVRELLDGLPDDRLVEAMESPGFGGELRHYQRRGLGWMQFLARLGLGGCLADDMGLGKTATTLAHLQTRPGPHLVICPLSVVRNWRSESQRFTPSFEVVVHHGAGRDGQLAALAANRDDSAEMFALDPERQLVVTTYGLLARDIDELAAVDWTTVVLDEAQMVKNPNTKAARAVRRLRADQKLALTGTPVENRLSELWSILDAVNPAMLGSLDSFRTRYSAPIERSHDPDAAARLRRLTAPFILRRTKADRRLLPDLPDKIEQIAYARLTREQATMYQQVVDQLLVDANIDQGMRRRGIVLAALMRLKQICNHPAQALRDGSRIAGRSGKLERFDELTAELLANGERALVFTQFREMGELLVRHCAETLHLDAPFLHGGTSRLNRDRMVDRFQDGSAPPLLIVSLKAGGTGLNLTAASQVIHYDRWWNPAVEDQATDRAWRLGQTNVVNVHKLVCEGTVEEKIAQVIDDKRALADQVIGDGTGEGWISELSTDALRELVRLEVDR